jgi:anti-anti-sigma regulatory factor
VISGSDAESDGSAVRGTGSAAATAAVPSWPPFAVEAQLDGPAARALVRGPVDASTAGRFLRRLLAASRAGTLPLTVDLSATSCLASAGVSALYRLARQLAAHGNDLVVVAAAASPAHPVLDLVGFPHRGTQGAAGAEVR